VRAGSTDSARGGRPDPVVAPPDPSAIARLRALLDVTRLVRAETDPNTILEAIADSIATSLGFATVVINTYRPAWNDFQVTAVFGSDEARRTLLGDTLPWEGWEPLLDDRFALGGAYMIPHGAFDWEDDVGARYIPDWEPSASPDAWHPDDELFVPMRHTDGHLLGIISVGEPRSGLRPSAHDVAGLVAVAEHAALALQSAQEAAAAAFHRAALRQLLQVSSRLTETLSAGAILQSVCEGISEALGKEVEPLGIAVTAVAPGSFRTDWAGRSMVRAPRSISDYDTIFNPIRQAREEKSGKQLGDPSKAARAILGAIAADHPPRHLLLGSDALGLVRDKLSALNAEIDAWEATTVSTDGCAGRDSW